MNQVTDKIWIGDLADGQHAKDFDWVLNVSHHEFDSTTDFHPMNDGKGSKEQFDEAARCLMSMLEWEDKRILVHCAAGISRSTSVTAAALGAHRSIPYHEAMEIVRNGDAGYSGRNIADPHPVLIDHAKAFIEENKRKD